MEQVECDNTGVIKEYVGCKVHFDCANCTTKLAQPILIQSFQDEFTLPQKFYTSPAVPNTTLTYKETQILSPEK